ncbi:MAG: PilZ domain-containing protein [Terriglobia bacterium]
MASYLDEEPEGKPDHGRKEIRWNIPVPVRVKGRGSDGKEFDEESITADASPSGMCVLLPVSPRRGDTLTLTAPEEGFESPAAVTTVTPLGANMNRVRLRFPAGTRFNRSAAARKYVYDFPSENWVGYIEGENYYNSKHEVFARLEGSRIMALDTGNLLFHLRGDRVYDLRGNCLGHLI